jgi:hypothetical protein
VSGFDHRSQWPQKFGEPLAAVRPRIDREEDKQGEMLLGAEPDRFAIWGEQDRLTEATEIPLRFHGESRVRVRGEYAGRSTDRQQLGFPAG